MEAYELLKYYDEKEKAAINILSADLQYLTGLPDSPQKRNRMRIQRNKIQEAADRRIAINKALEGLK